MYPIEALMADCRQYFAVTGRRVTFEYTLMAGVNDGRHHVRLFHQSSILFFSLLGRCEVFAAPQLSQQQISTF